MTKNQSHSSTEKNFVEGLAFHFGSLLNVNGKEYIISNVPHLF